MRCINILSLRDSEAFPQTSSLTVGLLHRIVASEFIVLNFMNSARSVRLEPLEVNEFHHLLSTCLVRHHRGGGVGALRCRGRWGVAGRGVRGCYVGGVEARRHALAVV